MRSLRIPILRTAFLFMLACAALPLVAQDAAQATADSGPLIPVDRTVLYALVSLAVVQVIFILAMAGIMRTMSGPGALAKWLVNRGGKAAVLLPVLMLLSNAANAQEFKPGTGEVNDQWVFWLLVLVNVFLFVLMLAQITVLKGMTRALVGAPERAELAAVKEPTWTDDILKSLTRQVEIEKEEDILMHHEYDGIRELDNVLPPWWLWLFYGTIIWSVVYLVNVHVINIWPDQKTEYTNEMAQAKIDVDAYRATLTNTVDENTVTVSVDAGVLASGKSIFTQYCTPCHGADAAGSETSVGPNLTDAHWIHGGGVKNVFKTIKYGVPEKGMISWKAQLKPAEMAAVSNYILSLQGTGGATQKAPQGDVWKEEGLPADSTGTEVDTLAAPVDTTRLAELP